MFNILNKNVCFGFDIFLNSCGQIFLDRFVIFFSFCFQIFSVIDLFNQFLLLAHVILTKSINKMLLTKTFFIINFNLKPFQFYFFSFLSVQKLCLELISFDSVFFLGTDLLMGIVDDNYLKYYRFELSQFSI